MERGEAAILAGEGSLVRTPCQREAPGARRSAGWSAPTSMTVRLQAAKQRGPCDPLGGTCLLAPSRPFPPSPQGAWSVLCSPFAVPAPTTTTVLLPFRTTYRTVLSSPRTRRWVLPLTNSVSVSVLELNRSRSDSTYFTVLSAGLLSPAYFRGDVYWWDDAHDIQQGTQQESTRLTLSCWGRSVKLPPAMRLEMVNWPPYVYPPDFSSKRSCSVASSGLCNHRLRPRHSPLQIARHIYFLTLLPSPVRCLIFVWLD